MSRWPAISRSENEGSDATIWLGSINTRVFTSTHDAALARSPRAPFLIVYPGITTPSQVVAWVEEHRVRILNVAGNRESVSPEIGERAERFLVAVFRRIRLGPEGDPSR